MRARANVSKALLSATKFFQANAGGVVGRNAETALRLARAEAWAEDEDVTFEVVDDSGSDSQYQDKDRSWAAWNGDVVGIIARHPDGREASLWGIMESKNNRERADYRRVVCAELAEQLQSEGRGARSNPSPSLLATRRKLKARVVKVSGYRATRYRRNPRNMASKAGSIVAWWGWRSAARLKKEETEAKLVEMLDDITDLGNANVGQHRAALEDAGYAVFGALKLLRPKVYGNPRRAR
jgi:hypothetical protein